MHYSHQKYWGSIVILEEGNQPHPRCPQCDMFVPQEALNRAHGHQLYVDVCLRGIDKGWLLQIRSNRWGGRGYIGVWDAADFSTLIKVPGTHFVVLWRRLTGSGAESTAGAGKVGTNGEDVG